MIAGAGLVAACWVTPGGREKEDACTHRKAKAAVQVKREEREHRFWAPWHHGVLAKGAETLTQGQQ